MKPCGSYFAAIFLPTSPASTRTTSEDTQIRTDANFSQDWQAGLQGSLQSLVTTAGTVVDASRVIDRIEISQRDAADAPPFSVDILRNDDGVSLIGLVPAGEDRDAILEHIGAIGDVAVTDLLEPA
ncbi:MAG: hypothetical protein ACO3CS_13795, partial [Alphaproteobacteria bacterium]